MSSPLAIAAVSAVLMDLLNDGLVNNDLSAVGSFKISASPPDRITGGAQEPNQINLFLYQVTPNPGWRNADLPSHGPTGLRVSNPPLALDLHYLVTAYGSEDLNAEILLGYAMELMHELRVIPRGAIRRSLSPTNPVKAAIIPPDGQGRFAADLADQIEQIKITPYYPNADELSKLWTAMQSRYRPSVAYQVTVVLIQATRPRKSALPVLTQGKDDTGPFAAGNLLPPIPTLSGAAVIDAKSHQRTTVRMGETLQLIGFHLAGTTTTAVFRHKRQDTILERPATVTADGNTASIVLPAAADADADDWRAGLYGVTLRSVTGDRTNTTNEVPIAIVPTIVSVLPMKVARAADGSLALNVTATPRIHPGQQASLLIGGDEYPMLPAAAATDQVAVTIPKATTTKQPLPLRLRVDNLDTLLVPDTDAQPPRYDPTQAISIT
jgi:hypothetical protein